MTKSVSSNCEESPDAAKPNAETCETFSAGRLEPELVSKSRTNRFLAEVSRVLNYYCLERLLKVSQVLSIPTAFPPSLCGRRHTSSTEYKASQISYELELGPFALIRIVTWHLSSTIR